MTGRREKSWKHLDLRSEKNGRARQLGIDYPRKTDEEFTREHDEALGAEPLNLLFICSRNQWRSPTAEEIWKRDPMLNVRSRGTSPRARRTVSVEDLRWADVVLVMEQKHRSRLLAEFPRALEHKPLHVLDIPDDYKFMDPELIEELERAVGELLAGDSGAT